MTSPPVRPPHPPTEPPPTRWRLPDPAGAGEDDLLALGADLEPGTMLAAYRGGLFPMGVGERGGPPLGWWSPLRRGVLEPGSVRVSRSLRRSLPTFTTTVDRAFDAVVAGCADPSRSGAWITPAVAAAYGRLHRLGWAHSIEVWRAGELVGGLYGLGVRGLFAGESMFHRATDASKAALVRLDGIVAGDGDPRRIIDVQWRTDHLATLGVTEMARTDYLLRLSAAAACPEIDWRAAADDAAGDGGTAPG